ncbi:hypothetical protein PVK06_009405 [Gossypium arboreum]|uniref:Retrotransposon gag domain-containing protein n=1 Tax=Gossypium arboreum TaxID=29729 RepID=A0ABR0QNS9_GOSAR|nr:hypothetical protein PVK06_009405 [Gossypium arboreum]
MENVRDMWGDIRQYFSIGNDPRVQQLRSYLTNYKLDGQTIVNYYGQLNPIKDELNNYDKISLCSCGGCRSNLTTELEKKRGKERVHKLVISLDEEHYGTVCANILSIDQLSNLNRVYAMVLQLERVRIMS